MEENLRTSNPVCGAFTLAARTVHLRVAGDQLCEAFLQPFAHLPLAPETATPDLTFEVFDRSRFDGVPIETPREGRTWNYYGHSVTASADGRFVFHRILQSGSMWRLDRSNNYITGIVQDVSRLTLYERGKTGQLLLPFWLETQGLELIHAGLVAHNGRGALITGPNGSGKSTTALSCLCSGFDYLGDDYIAIDSRTNGKIQGYSIYGCGFLDPTHLARFPAMIPHAIASPHPLEIKRLVLLKQAYPSQLQPAAELEFLLLPRIGATPTALTRATRGEALRQLAPSSLMMLARPAADALARMARLVEQLDCYWLDLGPDIESIPRHVGQLLGR
jgi:hypothetical protein